MLFYIFFLILSFYILWGAKYPILIQKYAGGILILLIILLKFILIFHNEIIIANDDMAGYIGYAKYGFFGSREIPFRPFFYPLWLFITSFTKIPYRYIIEGMYIASAGLLAYALLQYALPKVSALLLFCWMVFHPFSFGLLNTTYSESIYHIVLAAYLSFVLLLMKSTERKKILFFSILSGVFLFFLWHTRDENPLSLSLTILTCFFCYLQEKTNNRAQAFHQVVKKLSAGGIIFLFLMISLPLVFQIKWGTRETGTLLKKEEMQLLDALTRIKPDHYTRYVQISSDAMQRAFQVSPAMQSWKKVYDDLIPQFEAYPGSTFDVDASVFLWHLKTTLSRAGVTREDCRRAAQEILDALHKNIIPSRFSLGYQIPRDLHIFPDYPTSFVNCLSILLRDQSRMFNSCDGMPAFFLSAQRDYDHILNRKKNDLRRETLHGWCFAEGLDIGQVSIYPNGKKIFHDPSELSAISTAFYPKPELQKDFQTMQIQDNPGFVVSSMEYTFEWNELSLIFYTTEGKPYTIVSPVIGIPQEYSVPGENIKIHYFIEKPHSVFTQIREYLRKSQYKFGEYYTLSLIVLTGMAFMIYIGYGLLLLLKGHTCPKKVNRSLGLVVLWAFCIIVLRISFYAAIDSYFYYAMPPQGDDPIYHLVGPRFLYPVCILYPAFLFMLISFCLKSMKTAWSKEVGGQSLFLVQVKNSPLSPVE